MSSFPVRLTALAAVALLATAACGDDNPSTAASSTTNGDRSAVTITMGDGTLDLPGTIAGGLVDVRLVAEPGEQSHHLVFARLNDGVTYDALDAAGDEGFFELVTLRGGNGSLAPGDTAALTLDLDAGDYQVLDLPEGEVAAVARMSVTSAGEDAPEPRSEGTITLGPGMSIGVPSGFEGTGRWQFANADTDLPHEAVLVALEAGATTEDLVEWASTFAGPPPGDLIGGFGSLSGGQRGWLDLPDHVEPGSYAFVCLLPGPDGIPHAANGMVTGFTVQ